MKDKKTSLWPLPLTALLGLACSLSQLAVPTPGGNDRVATVVAQTLAALDVEAHVEDVPVLDDIGLPFQTL